METNSQKNNADIFISLHADFNRNSEQGYIAIYPLRRLLIKKLKLSQEEENKSDLIDGVDLSEETSEVTSILLDLTKGYFESV